MASDWVLYVKKYAAANGLTYKQALAEASKSYKQKKGGCYECKSKKKCKDESESEESEEYDSEGTEEYDSEESEEMDSDEYESEESDEYYSD